MTTQTIPTRYAPAARTPNVELARQYNFFANRKFLHQILDAVPNVFLILNQQRQIVYANKAMLKLLNIEEEYAICGLRPGEALGCTHAFETMGGCGTTEFCSTCGAAHALISSLRGREAVKECRITLKNGQPLDLRVWGKPLVIEGETYSMFAVQDISHEKRRQVLERIFFHDILNTAGGLQGVSSLLQDATTDELNELKEMVYTLADRLVEEIQTQRIVSSAENNDLTVNPTLIHSLEFMRETADIYRNHEVAESRQIRIDPDAHDVSFMSDQTLLGRVISNLLKNALEASEPGQAVTMGCRTDSNSIEFWVHNPTLMPHEVQLQIFQRSFSTKGNGRGLGTYSIKLLAERYLHGSVSFVSTPDDGTIFFVKFPFRLQR